MYHQIHFYSIFISPSAHINAQTRLSQTGIMHIDTVIGLTNWQDDASQWESKPMLSHKGVSVDLSTAVGPNAVTPKGAPDQPRFHPKQSKYQFDPILFNGPDAKSDLIDLLSRSCPGCTLYLQLNGSKNHQYQLRCNHYPIEHQSSIKFSDPQCFTKDNVAPITNKRSVSYSKAAFHRMKNPKMRSRPRVSRSVDRRKKKSVSKQKNKRGQSHRAIDGDHRCHMNIKFFMNDCDGSWHLHVKSSFEHEFHVPTEEDVSTLSRNDLSPDHSSALNILFQSGVSPTIIAKVMTELVHMSSDKKGTSNTHGHGHVFIFDVITSLLIFICSYFLLSK